MGSNNKPGASDGVGVTELLQVALIVLKLCGVIDWSWWWVFAPSLITIACVIIGVGIGLLVAWLKK